MSRAKQYDRTDLLNRSVELFRRQGYNGTSTAELVKELGINRKSMYAEFGSKQELFEAVLDHYNNTHLTRVLAPVEAADAGVSEIKQAFYGYASAIEGAFRGLGCLMCNTAAERGALDPRTGRFVAEYLERINQAFRQALQNGQESGEINNEVDLDEMAGFLTTALIGVAASVRAEAPPAQVWASYHVISTMLDGLKHAKESIINSASAH